jgi:hypothetical protein
MTTLLTQRGFTKTKALKTMTNLTHKDLTLILLLLKNYMVDEGFEGDKSLIELEEKLLAMMRENI